MGRTAWIVTCSLVAVAVTACGGKRVQVPPHLQLAPYGQVGLVTFTVENAKGSLHELATERFAEYLLAAQPGVEVLELGDAEQALGSSDASRIDASGARVLGEQHGVPAAFVGHLIVSDVKPKARIVGRPSIGAEVKVTLSMRFVSTESGGTLWRSSAWARQTVAALGLIDGEPYFTAEDPNEAYGNLVDLLIYEVTRDLRPRYVKR